MGWEEIRQGVKFCAACGSPLDLGAGGGERPRPICTGCGRIVYLDPKVAVGAIVPHAGGVVLLRRAIEPGYGKWVFPGGFVDRGEPLEAAATREVREEVGLEVEVDRLLGAYSARNHPVVLVVYVARVTGGVLGRGLEALEVRIFGPDALPWEGLAFDSTAQALTAYVTALNADHTKE